MFKKPLVAVVTLCCLTSFASAAVLIGYDSPADFDPILPGIQVFWGSSFIVNISASSTEPSLSNGGFIFNFSAPSSVTLNSFSWLPPLSNPNDWFSDPSLPSPSAVTFGPQLPLTPFPIHIANLNLTLGGGLPGTSFTVFTNVMALDLLGGDQPVVPGSESFTIEVPEPATLGFLLLSCLMTIGRRRSTGSLLA